MNRFWKRWRRHTGRKEELPFLLLPRLVDAGRRWWRRRRRRRRRRWMWWREMDQAPAPAPAPAPACGVPLQRRSRHAAPTGLARFVAAAWCEAEAGPRYMLVSAFGTPSGECMSPANCASWGWCTFATEPTCSYDWSSKLCGCWRTHEGACSSLPLAHPVDSA